VAVPAGEQQQQQQRQQQGSRKRRSKQPLDEAVRAWLVAMSLADCCDAFAQVPPALCHPHEPSCKLYHFVDIALWSTVCNNSNLMCGCVHVLQAGIGFADLPGLGDADLQALGVRALGRRRRIITAAAGLRAAGWSSSATARPDPAAGGPHVHLKLPSAPTAARKLAPGFASIVSARNS
jgi:hypothetical protein